MAPVPSIRRNARGGLKRTVAKGRREKRARRTTRTKKSIKTAIKKVVKNVIECDFNNGIYEKAFVSMNDIRCNDSYSANAQSVITYTQRNLGNAGVYTPKALALEVFTTSKLLDAASVLYNGKSSAINYEATSHNFDTKGLKINYQYVHASWRLKNATLTAYDCDLYEATPKQTTNTSFSDAWDNSHKSAPWIGTTPGVTQIGITPGQAQGLKRTWDYKKHSFRMMPGDEKVFHFTFKGCIDYEKLRYESSPGVFDKYEYIKNLSKTLTLISVPTLDTATDGANNRVGRMTANLTPDAVPRCFVWECKELTKVQQPDETLDTYAGHHRLTKVDYEQATENFTVYQLQTNSKNVQSIVPLP